MKFSHIALIAVLIFGLHTGAARAAIPAGSGEMSADLQGANFEIFTYRPDGCKITGALLVFHGVNRNPDKYRDDAIPLAQRACMLVIAPLFDKARFPDWKYQHGGIAREDGAVQPQANWTVNFVPRLAAWVRQQEGRADLPYALIGHSAGGQFLSRVAAFADYDATQTIIANPSTWVRARLDVAAPYGFGGVFGAQGEAALQRYLAMKITVLLGQEDTGSRNLALGEEADEQGATRLERGQNVFQEAQDVARQHGWTFNWHLAVIPGAGHSAATMFSTDEAFQALTR